MWRNILFVFMVFQAFALHSENPENYYPAGHELINYLGRIDDSARDSVRYDWQGVQVRFRFTGESLKLHFRGGERNYFDLFIDGKNYGPLHATGDTVAHIDEIEGQGPHEGIFFKRTEGEMGTTVFYGIETGSDGKLLAPPSNSGRKIEFIGNSITCGYGTEGANRHESFRPETENAWKSWASIISRAFDADCHIVAHSGLGVIRNYGDSLRVSEYPVPMPDRFNRTLDMETAPLWDFSRWIPDVVVINLGTNDFSTPPHPREVMFQRKYEELLKKVRDAYGEIPVFCVVGPLTDEPCHRYVKEMVRQFNVLHNDGNIHFVSMPPALLNEKEDLGSDSHPSYLGQKKMARMMVPVIGTVTGWEAGKIE